MVVVILIITIIIIIITVSHAEPKCRSAALVPLPHPLPLSSLLTFSPLLLLFVFPGFCRLNLTPSPHLCNSLSVPRTDVARRAETSKCQFAVLARVLRAQ